MKVDHSLPTYDNISIEVNLFDLVAHLLFKWKWILLTMLIGMLAAFGIWKYASSNLQDNRITLKQVNMVRSGLSDEKAEHAEYIHAQYLSYKQYRKSLQDYLSDSLYSGEDYTDNIALTVLYFVNSDIANVNQVFTRLGVGKEEYEKIAEVLGKENATLDDVYRRVSIGDVNVSVGENMNITLTNSDENEQKKNLLQVYLVMESEEQAEAAIDIIEKAFQKKLKVLKDVDPQIEFTKIGINYSTNISAFMSGRQNSVVNYLNAVNDQINHLQTAYVDKMDPDEKNYYSLLKERSEQEVTPAKRPSLIKYLLIGAFLGLVIAGFWFIVKYIFNGRVKTPGEMSLLYQIDTSNILYKKVGRHFLFGRIARKLMGIDLSDIAVRMNLVASDISIKLEKMGCSSAYLVCAEETEWEKNVCKELKDSLQERTHPVDLRVGNPLSDPKELEIFSQAPAVLVITQMKVTSRNELKKWIQLCRRYELPIMGTVALEEC